MSAQITLTARQRRFLRRCTARALARRHDRLAIRARLKDQLEARSEDGRSYVEIWSRDCDLAEGTELRNIPTSVMAFRQLENLVTDGAEGPVIMTVLTPAEAAEWEASFRDVAAERAGY